ncbi:hypothetical protein PHMEG_0002702 [Phytophthora megakarya]|uniref:Uncharacterized protein n=1 Tax=Phytophthora megakarya TaxID=4795 RepID=A0A225WYD8_9STRA|nr:hypothetical protein PHMEG_0002702 [Phytophthora megakarya]
MSRAGVYDLLTLKELILRDEELTQVDETCAQNLSSLEILSLSHNRLASLEYFQYFVNLIEINLNFNQIETLDNLQCAGLEKLFIANNQVVDMSPLRKLLRLNTISVYGNRIADLDSALHTCRGLPKLRSLDLGGNPCSRDVGEYKFRVVRALSRLDTLDGDQITQLDKDLTEEFFASIHKRSRQNSNGFIGTRPFTAPAAGARGSLTAVKPDTKMPNDVDPFASNLMPRGNVRLFRDDFLNNSPILLEYMAQGAGETSSVEINSSDEIADEDSTPSIFGFVDKLRSANPLPTNDLETDTDAVTPTSSNDLKKLNVSSSVSTSHLNVDPSDPNITIRKLLKLIEVLMESLEKYKNHQLDSVSESLLGEIKQLQTENNNIPILQEQIHTLKKQLAVLESNPNRSRALETKRIKLLEVRLLNCTFLFLHSTNSLQNVMQEQNSSLQRENARLKEMVLRQTRTTEESLDALKTPRIKPDDIEEATKNQNDAIQDPKRLAHSELLDESAMIDVELTELILQNEVSLELIRNDIKNTKKEWESHFEQAKSAEIARVRPKTSLGLSNSSRSEGDLDLTPNAQNGVTLNRRLHTSAGHPSGPEIQLLRQVPIHPLASIRETSSNSDGSTTNILTF